MVSCQRSSSPLDARLAPPADTARAGTDGDVRVTWRCGALNATTGFAPVKCGALRNCFERNQVDTFEVGFDSGRWSPTGACCLPSVLLMRGGGPTGVGQSFAGSLTAPRPSFPPAPSHRRAHARQLPSPRVPGGRRRARYHRVVQGQWPPGWCALPSRVACSEACPACHRTVS